MTNDDPHFDDLVQCASETVEIRVDSVLNAFFKLEERFTVEHIFVPKGGLQLLNDNENSIDYNHDEPGGSLGCLFGADIREHLLVPKGQVMFTTDGTRRKLRGSVAIMER